MAYAWAAGESFAEVVEAEELSGGDFVRNIKQLIDLLRQIAEGAPEPATRRLRPRPPSGCSGVWWPPPRRSPTMLPPTARRPMGVETGAGALDTGR